MWYCHGDVVDVWLSSEMWYLAIADLTVIRYKHNVCNWLFFDLSVFIIKILPILMITECL